MNLVIVESPSKAKTINKYLGNDYTVLASYGHMRDLPSKTGSVRPDEDFAMDWLIDSDAQKNLAQIVQAAKTANHLYLATDPDREGEAISWHVLEILKEKKLLKTMPIDRIVFHEITRNAVTAAMKVPRRLDQELVNAYLARRALDYLVGFTLSPVLWRKLPGAKSAGRVQSVALRLVCEREKEIEEFKSREYWTINLLLTTIRSDSFTARLTHLNGEKLDRFSLKSSTDASNACAIIAGQQFHVSMVETKPTQRSPAPPFTTSTLQQEASRKLGFHAKQTMMAAQRLYEGIEIAGETTGLITYMRTDSVMMGNEAINNARQMITQSYAKEYLPTTPRIYKTKSRNAQEAHEAIRPTDFSRHPESLIGKLNPEQHQLYSLIWKRAVASQMAAAQIARTTIDIISDDQQTTLRANGSIITFDGFLTLYQEGVDDGTDEDGLLPIINQGEKLTRGDIKPLQHFTEPPPRYSEASLVKKLEELGIGRPSTYASILSTLREREYVVMNKGRFVPAETGRFVTIFLENYFKRYVEYDFTAALEEQLDDVSNGKIDWKLVLRNFWNDFIVKIDDAKNISITDVISLLENLLTSHLFPPRSDGHATRDCPSCNAGQLSLRLGKFGAFLSCSRYPDCNFTKQLGGGSGDNVQTPIIENKLLGNDPATQQAITLRSGRFGPYVQLGEGVKPKRSSIPRDINPDDVDLELGLSLLRLPRFVGTHPVDELPITASIGRFGPYIVHNGIYAKLSNSEEALTIGLNHAVILLANPPKARGSKTLQTLGNHPQDNLPITVMEGRYGPYVHHNGINATLPKGHDPATIDMETAIALLTAKEQNPPKKVTRNRSTKPAVKTTTKAATKTAAAKTAKPKRVVKKAVAG